MSIRLNLLAEAQALEELRRRDPVKRAIMLGGFFVALVVIWSIYLQVRIMSSNNKLSALETKTKTQESDYQQVINNQKKLEEIDLKRAALRQLATNRFLQANALNALQTATVDGVQLVRLKVMQQYAINPEVKPKTNDSGVVVRGKPATATETITLVLEARDASARGEHVSKYKEKLTSHPHFQSALGKTNEFKLISLVQNQSTSQSSQPYASFSLECRFPEKTR